MCKREREREIKNQMPIFINRTKFDKVNFIRKEIFKDLSREGTERS